MRVLIVGNGQSVFIRDFTQQMVEKLPLSSIDVLSPTVGMLKKCRVHTLVPKNRCKIPKLRGLINLIQYKKLLKGKEYDVAHVHFVDILKVLAIKDIRKSCKKLIVTIWGSDFYRSSPKLAKQQEKVYDAADTITFATQDTLENFNEFYKRKYESKLTVINFGLAVIDELYHLAFTKEQCREHFGIPKQGKVVAIGYNSNTQQNHIKVIESIASNRANFGNIFFVLPLTYGYGSKEYIAELKDRMRLSGFQHLVLETFMSPFETAMFRKACDVLIQVQDSDALSGSMLEHLYAGNAVVTGNWLPYKKLNDLGLTVVTTNSPRAISAQLAFAIRFFEQLSTSNAENLHRIYEFASWKHVIQRWADLYRGGET